MLEKLSDLGEYCKFYNTADVEFIEKYDLTNNKFTYLMKLDFSVDYVTELDAFIELLTGLTLHKFLSTYLNTSICNVCWLNDRYSDIQLAKPNVTYCRYAPNVGILSIYIEIAPFFDSASGRIDHDKTGTVIRSITCCVIDYFYLLKESVRHG